MPKNDDDVTSVVKFENNDDELLPITECMCGAEFKTWEFTINIYRDDANKCPKCNRSFYFTNSIHIYVKGD